MTRTLNRQRAGQIGHGLGDRGAARVARIGSRGAVPDGVNLAALCKWAGLNAAEYSVDLRGVCDD